MDRQLIKKAVLIPVITGIIIGALFTVVFKNVINGIMPFSEGAQLATHEVLALGDGEAADSVADAADNTRIGATVNGRELVKEADYALLGECISVKAGSNEFKGSGCRYLQTLNCFAADFSDELTVAHSDGTQQAFTLTEDYSVSSEEEALATAPRSNSSLVVYYQERGGAGLSTSYHVMIYEEVA